MKIGIISDSHDNIANLEKVLAWFNKEKISVLIHAGDVAAPGVLVRTISPLFTGKIHLIFGNVGDRELLEDVIIDCENVKYYGDKGELEIDTRKIFFVHFPEEAEKQAATGKYDLVIHGHTHQAYVKKVGETVLLNPGTVGGIYNKATFAVYDTVSGGVEINEI